VGDAKVLLRLCLVGWVALASQVCVAGPLITPQEAALPPAEASTQGRAISRGPGIKQITPDLSGSGVKSPLTLKIAFEPRGGSKINTGSVNVVYLKSPVVDLTGRVKPGLTETGIDLPNSAIPPGDHQIRVTVQDTEGRQSSALISLKVVP